MMTLDHVELMGEMKYAYNTSVGNLKEREHLVVLGI
jgi:hypothetical protein